MSLSTLTSKGQTTVPKNLREKLHLEAGTQLEWLSQGDGTILLKPHNKSALSIKGIIKKPCKTVTIEDMDRAISDMASSEHSDSVQ